ncbi:cilia- and flagella-associated protein 58 [Cryptotermes secundus]|nr:cilia- and flagella-associated protein 58 [Cryptotermes secundus]
MEEEGKKTFAQEYTRIFEAFYKAYVHEEELMKENEMLQTQVKTNTDKVAVAGKLAAADKEIIDQLKDEINQARRMVDSAHAREENSQQVIENLRHQINQLNAEIEQRARLGLDQLEESGSAKKDKENFLREREEHLMHEVEILRGQLASALTVQEDLKRKNSAIDVRCNELTQELENQTNEINKELRVKEHLEQELKMLSTSLQDKDSEATNLKHQLSQAELNIGKLEANVKDLKTQNEHLQRDVESLNSRLTKVHAEFELQTEIVEKLTNENSTKTHELKMQGEEVTRLRNEASKVGKVREQYIKKLTQAENQHQSLMQEKEMLKGVIGHFEKNLETAKKQAENSKKICDDLQREKDNLNKNILKAAGAAYEQQEKIKLQEQVKRNLEQGIDNFKSEVNKQRKIVASLEEERDRYVLESQKLTQKLQDTLAEVKLKQVSIVDYKKKIEEADTKFHTQQKLFEAVQSDRNTFRKLLLEAQDEISELKQKLKILSHQTEQLKEDITMKEAQLLKEENALQKSKKEREIQKIEIRKLKDELHDSKEQITAYNLEERKLLKIIQDGDHEREKQKKEMERIMNERDIQGTQLARRNDELSSLHDKTKILQTTLHNGEAQYDQRLEDIRLLKLDIKRLRQEKDLLTRSMTNMTDMRQEIFHLETDLTREQLKRRALEEELQNPLNIHRWRKLEGSDPATHELILKIQLLQKRLIVQAQTTIKQEAQLKECELLYSNLRQLLARQPGPEMVTQLQEMQHALKAKDRKIKCLAAELNMYEAQVSEYKSHLARVNEELQTVKKKYFAQVNQSHMFYS